MPSPRSGPSIGVIAAFVALSAATAAGCGGALSAESPQGDAAASDAPVAPEDAAAASEASADSASASDAGADATVPLDAGGFDGATDSESALEAGGDAAVCAPGARQCSDDGGVITCDANGQWSGAVPCAPAAPFCDLGGCTATPPSCQPGGAGMTNCGGDGGESCCASLEAPGGSYNRTYTPESDGGAIDQADPVTVSGFRLDKYLVTVGRFRQFVRAVLPADGGAGWLPSEGSGRHTYLNGGAGLASAFGGAGASEQGWVTSDDARVAPTDENLSCPFGTWTSSAGGQENLPANCVTWAEAYAFCIWDGGFLPSEAEWEFAAAAGSQQRTFPWGATAPGTESQYAIYGDYYPTGSASGPGVANIAPVGTATLGAGAWGQLDLAGELYEWNLDFVGAGGDPYTGCTDCANVEYGGERVTQGGDFSDVTSHLVPSWVIERDPTERWGVGMRCARAP